MTNEVLQKTASDEQNVSSSNGLEPKLRFPNFIEKWTRFEAENIFKNITDKNHPTDTVLTIQQGRGTLPRDLSGRNILYDNTNTKNYKRVQFGDFIIHLRSFEGGLEMANEQGIVSPAYTILRYIKPIAFGFYKAYFRTNEFINHILSKSVEGIRDGKQISYDAFKWLAIPYCQLEEQQKIADFLSLVDQRIEKQRQLVESLKKYKRGLFLKLYNDSDKSIISFKNIYEMASEGGTPSTSDSENYENGKIPFIKIDDLNQHYLNFAKYFITEKGLKKSSAWIVPENSIIYSNGATIGACSINKIPVTTKQGILGIVPKSNFSVEFLYFFFTSSIFKQKIRAITTKGTMDCAYLKDINGIKISIPDFIAQQKIAKIMVDFENLIERTELSFIYLQNIKKALLQQMFI